MFTDLNTAFMNAFSRVSPPLPPPLDYLMCCATVSVDVSSLVRDRKPDCKQVSVNFLHTVTEIIIQFLQTRQTSRHYFMSET